MKKLWRSLVSLVSFAKVTAEWRWYDYGYTLAMIVKGLELQEKEWGVHTHYIGDGFTKKRMQVLLRMYQRYMDADCYRHEDKYLRMFLRMYARNVTRFWD